MEIMDATRQQLLAHPERYVIRAWDMMHSKFVNRHAATVKPEDLRTLDLRLVLLLPVED